MASTVSHLKKINSMVKCSHESLFHSFGKRAPREPLRFGKRSAPAAFELFSDEGDY